MEPNLAEWLTAIAGILAAFATVATVIILVWQITDLKQSVRGQTYQAVYSQMLELDRFFFDHPQFRKYFYDGENPPEGDRERATIVAELICDLFDDVYHQEKTMPAKTFKEWQTYMRFLFQKSSFSEAIMNDLESCYPEEYRKHVLRT